MNFEELLEKLNQQLEDLQERIEQVEELIEDGLDIRWGLWIVWREGNRQVGVHIYSTSRFLLLEENKNYVRYLVDSTIVDLPKHKKIDIQFMPIDELPPLPEDDSIPD